ncbi:DUF86 domain-containing protein [Niallia endozanthoxylica]|uniref:DUF86 domain-containing protein n=1 Tax=Niallia endozanthoxylica TaxID=2036016 RepID=A0A5J5HGT5_9BACI|nr:DUF86 domain-containing protein [Niallia endozanthoxylica]KAA9019969.1 DUF86 domain-containing protein [Niallia endozanthoxylica]
MYFVDRDKIEETLTYLEGQIGLLEENKEWDTAIEKAALERILHMMLESILDVGNGLIDGFIMRDPGSYDDIIDILEDEKVITKEMSMSYKRVIKFRKNLQQQYTNINHQELLAGFQAELIQLKQFTAKVREYLENELGPVTAFKPTVK